MFKEDKIALADLWPQKQENEDGNENANGSAASSAEGLKITPDTLLKMVLKQGNLEDREHQKAILEALKRALSPEEKQALGPELMMAENALSSGGKVDSLTMNKLNEALNKKVLQEMLKDGIGGALALAGCGGILCAGASKQDLGGLDHGIASIGLSARTPFRNPVFSLGA